MRSGGTAAGWAQPAPEFGQFDRLSDRKTLGKSLDQTETSKSCEHTTYMWTGKRP